MSKEKVASSSNTKNKGEKIQTQKLIFQHNYINIQNAPDIWRNELVELPVTGMNETKNLVILQRLRHF